MTMTANPVRTSLLRRFGPILLALGGLVVLLVSIGVVSVRQATLLQNERVSVRHSLSMVETLEAIGIAVRDAETGQRGYLLTGKPAYLLPHDDAVARLPSLRAELRRLTRDDQHQRALDRALDPVVDAKLAELAETIRLRRAFDEAAARRVVLSDVGQRLMVRITATLEQMHAEEKRRLQQRRRVIDRTLIVMDLLSLGGFVTGAAALGFAGLVLRRFVTRLQESEATFRLLAEHAEDVVARVNADGTLRYVSPSVERILGVRPAELIGSAIPSLIHPDDQESVRRSVRRMLTGVIEQEAMSFRVIGADGGEVWLESTRRLLRDPASGAIDGFVSVSRDISGRRRHEAELEARAQDLATTNTQLERMSRHLAKAKILADQASLAKSRFLASMSHELRTPLNAILGYAQLLRNEGRFEPVQSARLDAMLEAGQHLLDMINRVLDLSEIEAASVELKVAEVDPRDVAETCLNVVRGIAAAKGLALDMQAAAGTPTRLAADPTRLRQILLNLLGNAVKFTEQGRVTLRLHAPADTMLRFEVLDTGPGVPADTRHLLFNDFKRLNAGIDPVEGTGLGLAISARLAALMGGRIEYEDRPDGGSVFSLELPVVAPDAVAATKAIEASARPARSLRVLVVDDMPMNRDIAGSFLRAAGHAVTCAETGAEAIEAAGAADYDIVLMDVRMPGMSGLEATRRIRRLPGARGRVRVLALTAQAFAEQIEDCRRAGMDDHLVKPFAQDALLAAVARLTEPQAGGASDRADASVCDRAAFEQVTALLPPGAVATYLQVLVERGERLRSRLQDGGEASMVELAEAAHILAGSAGMFGFHRLTESAKHFEKATLDASAAWPRHAKELSDTLEASLAEMHRLKPALT